MKDAIGAVNDHVVATKTNRPAGPLTARTPCDSHPAYPCSDSFETFDARMRCGSASAVDM
jgi:hypothetical protein